MFDSKDPYPDSELTEKLNRIGQKAWMRRALKIGIEVMLRVKDFKVVQEGHPLEKPSLFLLQKALLTVTFFGPYLLTDEVVVPWKFTAKYRSVANVWSASRITLKALARRFFS